MEGMLASKLTANFLEHPAADVGEEIYIYKMGHHLGQHVCKQISIKCMFQNKSKNHCEVFIFLSYNVIT